MPPYCTLVGTLPGIYASLLYTPGYTTVPPSMLHCRPAPSSYTDAQRERALGSREENPLGREKSEG